MFSNRCLIVDFFAEKMAFASSAYSPIQIWMSLFRSLFLSRELDRDWLRKSKQKCHRRRRTLCFWVIHPECSLEAYWPGEGGRAPWERNLTADGFENVHLRYPRLIAKKFHSKISTTLFLRYSFIILTCMLWESICSKIKGYFFL